jgi:hypothetical protein
MRSLETCDGNGRKEMVGSLLGWMAQRSQTDVFVGWGYLGEEGLVGDKLPRGLEWRISSGIGG